jgi:hypothetical protein
VPETAPGAGGIVLCPLGSRASPFRGVLSADRPPRPKWVQIKSAEATSAATVSRSESVKSGCSVSNRSGSDFTPRSRPKGVDKPGSVGEK